eukprot:TRINITY_DN2055_c0_g1_i1.p3 TRINITY_DN2055_c0_g1~~TRINITY_DN2055_c0_g1_i1.p3  ORF type:complete len:125 (-),score=25.85 TRINITY_DN2055_c0_g1_i1:122-496(-)
MSVFAQFRLFLPCSPDTLKPAAAAEASSTLTLRDVFTFPPDDPAAFVEHKPVSSYDASVKTAMNVDVVPRTKQAFVDFISTQYSFQAPESATIELLKQAISAASQSGTPHQELQNILRRKRKRP